MRAFRTSHDGSRYPRLQLLTIKDLLEGNKNVQRPLHVREWHFIEESLREQGVGHAEISVSDTGILEHLLDRKSVV